MPWVCDHEPLADLLDEEAPGRCARKITDAVGDRLESHVRRNTPIDTNPFRDKPGRPRGSLRASIQRSDVEHHASALGLGYRVRVFTDDPIAPFVEFSTRPHIIRPRHPGGRLHWRGRRGHHFASEVHHPGTKGVHMMSRGALTTEAELDQIAAPSLARFERELVRAK